VVTRSEPDFTRCLSPETRLQPRDVIVRRLAHQQVECNRLAREALRENVPFDISRPARDVIVRAKASSTRPAMPGMMLQAMTAERRIRLSAVRVARLRARVGREQATTAPRPALNLIRLSAVIAWSIIPGIAGRVLIFGPTMTSRAGG